MGIYMVKMLQLGTKHLGELLFRPCKDDVLDQGVVSCATFFAHLRFVPGFFLLSYGMIYPSKLLR